MTSDAEPIYPQAAIDAGVEGTVVVTVVIDKSGNVTDAVVFRSVPQLDNAAIRAARAKVFSPGRINGEPVFTRMNIPIEFVLPEAAAAPEPELATGSDQGDFVDLTGEAIRIEIEPDRPRVNIIADRIKPEFDMVDLQRSFMEELTGGGEKVVIDHSTAPVKDEKIEIEKIVNRSR
jgi:TonB family protein